MSLLVFVVLACVVATDAAMARISCNGGQAHLPPPAIDRANQVAATNHFLAEDDTPLHRLAEVYSPSRPDPERPQRRESVTVNGCNGHECELQEVLCDHYSCVAITYTVPQPAVEAAMASEPPSEEPVEALVGLMHVLNESPLAVKSLARCHGAVPLHRGDAVQPTDVVEQAIVTNLTTDGLEFELVVVSIVAMAEAAAGTGMPRRMLRASLPLNCGGAPCASAAAVEDALLEMIDAPCDALAGSREDWGV